MELKELLKYIHFIEVGIDAKDKFDLLAKISIILARDIKVSETQIYEALKERELLGSTALGNGFAIPHFKSNALKDTMIGVFVPKIPIEFDAVDDTLVSVVFVVASPSYKPSLQLKILTLLAKLLKKSQSDLFLNKSAQEIKNYLENLVSYE